MQARFRLRISTKFLSSLSYLAYQVAYFGSTEHFTLVACVSIKKSYTFFDSFLHDSAAQLKPVLFLFNHRQVTEFKTPETNDHKNLH